MNPILAELRHEPGVLSWRGGRYLLIRPETLAALQRAVEDALGAARRNVSPRAAAPAAAAPPASSPARPPSASRSCSGWAPRSAGGSSCWTPSTSGAAPRPVCHLTRGVLESLTEAAFGTRWPVVETACAATGAPACRFEAALPGATPISE